MLGVYFLSSIGANPLQVTLTLNFRSEGVVQDRRGLNMSSIYGTNWVCGMPHIQLVLSRSVAFSHFLVSKLWYGNIIQHAANLIPNCTKHWFSYSLIHNLFQNAQRRKALCFTGKRCMSLSSHFLLFPNSLLIRLTWPCQWILQPEQHETAPKKKNNFLSKSSSKSQMTKPRQTN